MNYIGRFHYRHALVKFGWLRPWCFKEFFVFICRIPISQGCTRNTLGCIPSASLVIGTGYLPFVFAPNFHFLHRSRVLISRFFSSNPGFSRAAADLWQYLCVFTCSS